MDFAVQMNEVGTINECLSVGVGMQRNVGGSGGMTRPFEPGTSGVIKSDSGGIDNAP
jgi:hypothetical protein